MAAIPEFWKQMGGQRVEITKDALKLFMQSLPPKCKF
jgi:hypothetical protein